MQTILTVIQVFLSLGLIGLILIQHGKGADMGAAFGSGASSTVFGARGSGSFLTRVTAIMATIFFLTSMALAYYATKGSEPETIMDRVDERTITVPAPVIPPSDVPAIPGSGGDVGNVDAQGEVPSDVPVGMLPGDGAQGVDGPAADGMSEGVADIEATPVGGADEGSAPSVDAEERSSQ